MTEYELRLIQLRLNQLEEKIKCNNCIYRGSLWKCLKKNKDIDKNLATTWNCKEYKYIVR